jgi:TatD DNase family protein
MRALDSHVHLDFPDYDSDRPELIKDLESKQIGCITIATDQASWPKVDELSKSNPLVWGAIGLHPTEIGPESLIGLDRTIKEFERMLGNNPKLVALGEIGLDYFHSQDHIGDQKVVLNEFLNFAGGKDLPVIFHCRNAYGDLLTILKRYPKIRGVIHCYSGSAEQAKEYLGLGLYLSFTGMLTYKKNDYLRQTSQLVPLDRLLLETDAPFLSPEPRRGQRNAPESVMEIASQHAQLRGVSLEAILEATTNNAVRLFGLKEG